MNNGVVAKAQPITTMPILLNNFLLTIKLPFTKTAEQQSRNGFQINIYINTKCENVVALSNLL
jgi:hypothetical protein